ncbi:MAG: XdhC family protein [Pyrinomonadaceae bacterium]
MNTAGDKRPSRLIADAVARILHNSSLAVLATLVAAPENVGAKILIEESGMRVGSLSDVELDEAVAQHAAAFLDSRVEAATFAAKDFARELDTWTEARVLFERIEPEPRVVVCGAGHVGASLARLARLVNYRVTLVDDRAEFVARKLFPDQGVELVAATDWREATRRAVGKGRGVYVAVVTRGHSEDEECLRSIIEAAPEYVGLIGSKRRTNIVLERLRAEGFDAERLKEVRAPIGLDIGAVSPEEVALAILAEMIAVRRGGSGAPLSA